MKRALISCHIYSDTDREILTSLTQILAKSNFHVDTLTNKAQLLSDSLKIKPNRARSNDHFNEGLYDILFAVNKKGLLKGRKLAARTPTIYIIDCNRYYEERIEDAFYEKFIVVGRDNNLHYLDTMLPFITIPFLNSKSLEGGKRNNNESILFVFEHKSTLYQMASFINLFTNENLTLYSPNFTIPRSLFNSTIDIIPNLTDELPIESAKLIIGEGHTVIKAILKEKPVIVLGPFGYGSIVNKSNLQSHYNEGFRGRIGGYKGEKIPFSLLKFDITNITNLYKKGELLKLKEEIIIQLQIEKDELLGIVDFLAKQLPRIGKNTKLKKNSVFRLLINSSDSCLVLNSITGKFVCQISDTLISVIELFNEPSDIASAFKRHSQYNYPEFEKLIRKMIKLKILLYEIA